jgi:hypothetical protein
MESELKYFMQKQETIKKIYEPFYLLQTFS